MVGTRCKKPVIVIVIVVVFSLVVLVWYQVQETGYCYCFVFFTGGVGVVPGARSRSPKTSLGRSSLPVSCPPPWVSFSESERNYVRMPPADYPGPYKESALKQCNWCASLIMERCIFPLHPVLGSLRCSFYLLKHQRESIDDWTKSLQAFFSRLDIFHLPDEKIFHPPR